MKTLLKQYLEDKNTLIKIYKTSYSKMAKDLQFLNPGIAYCPKCGIPYTYLETKTVKTLDYEGSGVMCSECWSNSTLEEILLYHINTYLRNVVWFALMKSEMKYSLAHLLSEVEKEYNRTH